MNLIVIPARRFVLVGIMGLLLGLPSWTSAEEQEMCPDQSSESKKVCIGDTYYECKCPDREFTALDGCPSNCHMTKQDEVNNHLEACRVALAVTPEAPECKPAYKCEQSGAGSDTKLSDNNTCCTGVKIRKCREIPEDWPTVVPSLE